MSDEETEGRIVQRPPVTMTIDRDVIDRLKAFAAQLRTPYERGVPFSRVAEVAIVEYLDRHESELENDAGAS